MKKIMAWGLVATLCMSLLTGCGGSSKKDENTKYELTVSGIGGSLNWLPVYVAQEEGWFEEEGLKVEEVLFTNGPVQMESLSSDGWDIGCTGVGGVFAGVLGYDAVVVGSSNTDDGTQYVFARNDSEIVQKGTGNNSLNEAIYGTSETWKGKSILCNTGSVTQYILVKMLEGFGLTQEDVKFVAMDPATSYSAFLAGEGDACVLTGIGGTFKMLEATDKYTAVASGPMVDSGLMCSFVANKNSYKDPKKYEAMKVFMKVYFKSMDWIKEHEEEAVQYCVDMNDENGSTMDEETARKYIQADTYYTLEEAVSMMNDKAEGSENTVMEQRLLDVLDFFIYIGNYSEGDNEKFMGHVDNQLLTDVLSGNFDSSEAVEGES